MAESKSGLGKAKKYIPVNVLQDETYQIFKSYSELTGISLAKLVRAAMEEYGAVVLTVRMQTLSEQIRIGRSSSHLTLTSSARAGSKPPEQPA